MLIVRKNRPRVHSKGGVRGARAAESSPGAASVPVSAPAPAARLGRLESVGADGAPWVTAPQWLETPARALLAAPPPGGALEAAVGQRVVLLPLEGDEASAVIVGWIAGETSRATRELRVDGQRVVIAAEHELELQCGEARITLTADGRVLIQGRGVLTHARQVNRIRGGQVQIN